MIISTRDEYGNIQSWWQNFVDYHAPIWQKNNIRTVASWELYVNLILQDSAVYIVHYFNHLEFTSEESYIVFLLEWS